MTLNKILSSYIPSKLLLSLALAPSNVSLLAAPHRLPHKMEVVLLCLYHAVDSLWHCHSALLISPPKHCADMSTLHYMEQLGMSEDTTAGMVSLTQEVGLSLSVSVAQL